MKLRTGQTHCMLPPMLRRRPAPPAAPARRPPNPTADNSCINRVLEARRGIPITLGLVYMEVGGLAN